MCESVLAADNTPDEWLPLEAAAQRLGITSTFAVARWVQQGMLIGAIRDGQVVVSRVSVDGLRATPAVHEQRAWEHRVSAALESFDTGDEPPPADGPSRGGKPWVSSVPAAP